MTSNNNQPETNTPTFKKNQKFWVEAQITKTYPDSEVIQIDVNGATVYVNPEKLYTTEQIVQEHGHLSNETTKQKELETKTHLKKDKKSAID